MSIHSISYADEVEGTKLAVSFRLILALYFIIPICLTLIIIDKYYLNSVVLQNLPTRPESYLLFLILAGTPHIIASSIIITTNTDYLNLYKRRLAVMTVFLAAFFGIGSYYLPYNLLYVIVAFWTVFHVLKQQHGIARGICRLPGWAFHLLLWLSVIAGIFIYVGIFLKNSLDVQQTELIRHIAASLCACLMVATLFCQRYVTNRFGKVFLWANTLLVLSSFFLYLHSYYFMAILAPRLVHDATAYIFYVTHDYNKHHHRPQNFIYRFAKKIRLNVFVVLPLLSFALAFLLQAYGDDFFEGLAQFFFATEIHRAITLGLVGYLGLMHYYMESFTWKNDSPYRKYIAFTK